LKPEAFRIAVVYPERKSKTYLKIADSRKIKLMCNIACP
jgi:hypothetical protein